ncbi:MAG: hypothetical protein JNN30_15935 [Rhodanobacteraceae bacterium]|nr:hypothetical protein [Rhodanobacteraceae bacterium]
MASTSGLTAGVAACAVGSAEDANLSDRIKIHIYKAADTEAGHDDDLELLHRGGALVFVHASTDNNCRQTKAVPGKLNPVFARALSAYGNKTPDRPGAGATLHVMASSCRRA